MMSLKSFDVKMHRALDEVNHHTVNVEELVASMAKNEYPLLKKEATFDKVKVVAHENAQWGETIFEITYPEEMYRLLNMHYPETLI